jgi:hypothetical protein
MAYVEIENKEDSAEKLAAASGKPTKNFFFAADFNLIKTKLNALYEAFQNTVADFANQTESSNAATATNVDTINNTEATTPRGLRWFWNTLRSLAWTWTAKQTFSSVNLSALTTSQWLRLNASKDIESFDGQSLLNSKVDKGQTPLVATSGTATITLSTYLVATENLQNRILLLPAGNQIIVLDNNWAVGFQKLGTGTKTFTNGTGRTVVQVDETLLLNGSTGSKAIHIGNGTVSYLEIKNV